MSAFKRIASYVALLLTASASLRAGFYFIHVLVLEGRGAIDPDGVVYMIVGRGMLNGLRPYVDLFESKPPGMFFLGALSLVTTGDDRGALFLQVAIFTCLPLLLAGFAWHEVRKEPDWLRRHAVIGTSLLLGLLITLFLEERSGGFQTESFGAFFASLYLLRLFLQRPISTKTGTAINACLLLCTLGLKEPFFLTVLAGVLLLTRNKEDFIRAFLVPLGIAAVIGTAILAALSYLGPYLSLYVPTMLASRIQPNLLEPLWARGFGVGRLFVNLGRFAAAPLVGAIFAFLWFMAPALKTRVRDTRMLLLTLVTSAVLYVLLIYTRVFLVLLVAISRLNVSFHDAGGFIALRAGAYFMVAALAIGLLMYQHKRGLMFSTLAGCAALYFTCTAVGITDETSWHWGFAFPFLFSLALLFVRYAGQGTSLDIPVATVTIVSIAAGLMYQPSDGHLQYLRENLAHNSSGVNWPIARRFDQLLDRCHLSSYFADSSEIPLAMSRHSPLGPIFVLRDHTNYLPPDHPLLQQTYANIRDRGQLIVLGPGSHIAELVPDVLAGFTDQVPACAADLLPLDGLKVLFRRS